MEISGIWSGFGERLVRAAKVEVSLYEEVKEDITSFQQAMATVILASLATGIGAGLHVGFGAMIIETFIGLLTWFVWALLAFWFGTRLLPEPQTSKDIGRFLRAVGFSSAPGLIRVLGIIPPIQNVVFFVSSLWMLVAVVIAIRQSLNYGSTGRAIAVCAIGFVVQLFAFGFLINLLGGSIRGI